MLIGWVNMSTFIRRKIARSAAVSEGLAAVEGRQGT